MAKWEIIEDKKFKKQTGGAAKAAARTIAANKATSRTKPVTSNQSVIEPIITKTDKPVYTSVADYTNKRYGAPSITPRFGQNVQVAYFEGDAQPFYDDVATNYYKAYVKDYQQKVVDDKVSEFLKANPLPKTDKSKADYIENLSPYDRQLIKSSSSSNEFLPAFRQYENRVGENAKKYSFTEAFSDPDKLSEVTNAGLNRFRLFPNATNSIEDFVNPGIWFGQMEQGVGDIPKNIRDKNYLAATMGIAAPLTAGYLGGIGTKTTGQWVNNMVNPLAGLVDANVVKGLGNKAIDKAIGKSFTPELGNLGSEVFSPVKPTVLENIPFVNTAESQTSFFSRNPSAFTNRINPQESINLNRREVFNRISQRQPTTRRTYTLGNEEDLIRFNANNNFIPPPPSEYETARNLVGVNFSEAELNNMNIRDIARGINTNTSHNISSIDLNRLTPYKNLTFKELTIKNPSLAEKLKSAFNNLKLNVKNVADKTAEKLTLANKKLGQIIEPSPIINENKFQQDLVEKLNTGVGIKKGNTQINLKQKYPKYNPYDYGVFIKTPDATDFIHSGNIQLMPEINQRSFTDILLNKNKYQGLKKPWDFPLEELKGNSNFDLNSPEYKGISAEIGEAAKQALKNQNKKLDLLSSTSHTPSGGLRYLTEFLNGRKIPVNISQNSKWLKEANKLKQSLQGKSISKEEVEKILIGNNKNLNGWELEKAILKNPLFPNKIQFKYKVGGIIEDPMGQWAHPGEITQINSPYITMQGVPYPVLGVSNTGHTQMMYPGLDYSYQGDYVTEYPMMQDGGEVNFTYAGENHRVYQKESPTGNGKGIKGHIMVNHPTKNKGKWDTIDLTKITNGKVKTVAQGVASTKKWHKENPEYATGGNVSNWEILEDTNEDYEYKNGGKTPAWQRKEGKSPTGGLNAKGRASLKKEGHDIKPPQPQGGSRKKSFCARMTGLKKKLTGSKKANDPNSRINLSLKKWKC